MSAFAKGGAKAATTVAADALKSEGISQAKDFVLSLTNNNRSSGVGGGGQSNNKGSSPAFGGSTGSPANLIGAYETNPLSIELRPNLPAGVYSDTVNYPVNFAVFSHITGFKLQFDVLDTGTKFFFDNVLIPALQNRAQASVNFKVDLSLLSSVKLINYFNCLVNLLSAYYFCTSILAYCNIPTNKDRGMFALRGMITATDIDYLNQIRQLIQSYPVPPMLNDLIFFLYQTFTDGPNGQMILKFMPLAFNDTGENNAATGFLGSNGSVLSTIMTNMNSADNLQISSLLTQITPSWVKSTVHDPSPVPLYSAGFSTLFANAGHTYFSSGQIFGPNVPSDESQVFYLSLDDKLDGLILGLSCVFNNSVTVYRTGLSGPVNTLCYDGANRRFTNRWSYVYKTAVNTYQWLPSNANIESFIGRPEVARAYLSTYYYGMIPNSINVRGVSVNVIRESAKSVISWLMSIDTIMSQKTNRNIDKSRPQAKPKYKPSDKS